MAKKQTENITFDDIEPNSLIKMTEAGKIFPKLEATLKRVYKVKIISIPRKFESKSFGTAWSIDVELDNMNYSFVMSKSFRQQLLADMNREGFLEWNEPKTKITNIQWKNLINRYVTFQKFIGSTKDMDNVQLFSVQLEPKTQLETI